MSAATGKSAIFLWFVVAQFFLKFNNNSGDQKLNAWYFELWKNCFCILDIERPWVHQSTITFFYTPCITCTLKRYPILVGDFLL